MIDIAKELDDRMLCEGGAYGHINHIYEDPNLTFADIRDILTKVFSGEIELQEKIDGVNLMVTYKDGKFRVARSAKTLRDPMDYDRLTAKYCDAPAEVRDAFQNSLKDLAAALSKLSDVELNRFFANGCNFLNCEVVYPPCANVMDYGNRCFITLNGLKCYNDKFKEVGDDEEGAKELFKELRDSGALQQETFEITEPNILRLKNTVDSKEALANIMSRLEGFIDGVGWKCSLDQYVCDRYSRHIVNKALEHGIDVSRGSDFVTALSRRLSQISGRKPTKSDLVTYAKCDGVNTRDPKYKEFLADLEANADETNQEIIRPVEDLIIYAGMTLMKNVMGFMALDPSKAAKKLLADLEDSVQLMSEKEFEFTPDKIERFKKNLAKIDKYAEFAPAEGVVFMYKGKVLKMTGPWGPLNQLLGIVKYR